jgi:hypothetical protein
MRRHHLGSWFVLDESCSVAHLAGVCVAGPPDGLDESKRVAGGNDNRIDHLSFPLYVATHSTLSA